MLNHKFRTLTAALISTIGVAIIGMPVSASVSQPTPVQASSLVARGALGVVTCIWVVNPQTGKARLVCTDFKFPDPGLIRA